MSGFSGCPALILTCAVRRCQPCLQLTSVTAWLLILLVTTSTPITKSIDVVRITTVDGGFTVARAGVFGICYPGGRY